MAADVGRSGAGLLSVHSAAAAQKLWDCEPDTRLLAGQLPPEALHTPKLYIDSLSISRIRLALSFTPAPWRLRTGSEGAAAGSSSAQRLSSSSAHGPYGAASASRAARRRAVTLAARHSGVVLGGSSAEHAGSSSRGAAAGGGSSTMVRLLLSLAHLEGTWLTLKPLTLRHPLLAPDGLAHVSVKQTHTVEWFHHDAIVL